MSFTFTEHSTDGVTTTFPFRFAGKDKGYLRASDIVVYLKVDGEWTEALNWYLSGTNQITFTTEPAASTEINLRIRRIVPKVDPYAEFARGVTLDMRSVNYAFIQNLQAVQELMDGFIPAGFFYKEDLSMGFNKITHLKAGTEPYDAVNYSQLYAVDQKHTLWNQSQDQRIQSIEAGLLTEGVARFVPYYYTSTGGELVVHPPYEFTSCIAFLDGVFQEQNKGAFSIVNNTIVLPEPLRKGEVWYMLLGTAPVVPDNYATHEEVTAAFNTATASVAALDTDLASNKVAVAGNTASIFTLETVVGGLSGGGLAHQLNTKSIYFFGDSITEAGLYIPTLHATAGTSTAGNAAIAGQGMQGVATQVGNADLSGSDVVLIWAGINDYRGDWPLGVFTDAADTGAAANSFYYWVWKAVDTALQKKPEAHVYLVSPMKADDKYWPTNNKSLTLKRYVDAMQEVAEFAGVSFIDMYSKSQISLRNLDIYSSDRLHPNDAGGVRIGKILAYQLNAG